MKDLYHFDHYFSPARKIGEVDLIQIGRRFCSNDTLVEKHLHLNWFELTIATEGQGILTTNNTDIPIKRGDIYLNFPADEHIIRADKNHPLKYDYISFYPQNQKYLESFEKIILTFQNPASRIFLDSRISFLVENMILEFIDSGLQCSEKAISYIIQLQCG